MNQSLYVFAHRGEAQSFLKQRSFKAVPFAFEGLYKDSVDWLLICGEGHLQASQKLSAVLAVYGAEISRVLNLGVCGSLRSEIEIDSLVEIRTCYLENDGAMEFKSFSTEALTELPKHDLITTYQRVLKSDYAERLENFAQLVDREAWGLASVCQLFHQPFTALKMVSDFAGQGTEICVAVKEKAEFWSEQLFELVISISTKDDAKEFHDFQIPSELSHFHWTVSQKRELKNAIEAISRKHLDWNFVISTLNLSELILEKTRPKEKSSAILEKLWGLINPFHTKIHQSLENELSVLNTGNIKTKYDKTLESDELHLQAVIQHPRHLEQLKKSLDAFDFTKYQKILYGNIDV